MLVGRAAQGRPWIFREIAHYLATGELLPAPTLAEVRDILLGHLEHLHAFYGEPAGVRIARKHLGWYAKDRPENVAFRAVVNRAESARRTIAADPRLLRCAGRGRRPGTVRRRLTRGHAMSDSAGTTEFPYLHGFSEVEQARLVKQAQIAESTIFRDIDYTGARRLLEIGSGVGAQTEILLRRFPELHATCVDLNQAQIGAARGDWAR